MNLTPTQQKDLGMAIPNEKSAGTFFPCRPLNTKKGTSGILLVSGLFALILVACSGAAPQVTNETPNAGADTTEISHVLTEVRKQPEPEAITDAAAIVAAQEQVLVDIYDRLLPSVVEIRATRQLGTADSRPRLPSIPGFPQDQMPEIPENFFERSGGSGFLWDGEGRVVTNHHVVDGADRLSVIFSDGTERDADVVGTDPDSDLAVLQIVDTEGLELAGIPIGDSSAVRPGQLAVAIGNPFGQEFTITSGIISAIGRTIRSGNSQFSIPEVIQTDAPINPGNSGGPLLNRQGQVIGVNTQIISRSGANSGIGFAVPIDTAKRVIPELIASGEYHYAWLGISGTSMTPDLAELMELPRDTRGTLVIDVTKDGPAETAGLHGSDRSKTFEGVDFRIGGDVIVAIDGSPVKTIDDLIAYLVDHTRPDDESTLEVIREDGTHAEIFVTLDRRPSP